MISITCRLKIEVPFSAMLCKKVSVRFVVSEFKKMRFLTQPKCNISAISWSKGMHFNCRNIYKICTYGTNSTSFKAVQFYIIVIHFIVVNVFLMIYVYISSVVTEAVSRAGTSDHILQILWDVITCLCPWYLLLPQHSWYDLNDIYAIRA